MQQFGVHLRAFGVRSLLPLCQRRPCRRSPPHNQRMRRLRDARRMREQAPALKAAASRRTQIALQIARPAYRPPCTIKLFGISCGDRSIATGWTFQISAQYSRMVRSDENSPLPRGIQNGHARPMFLVAIVLAHLGLAIDVGLVIGQQEIRIVCNSASTMGRNRSRSPREK